MRILKWLIGLVVLCAAVIVIGSFLLPKEVTVARSIEIDAPADEIFPYVNSPKATQEWSPWLELDPEVALTFNDVTEGVGAKMEWASQVDTVGTGSMEVVESTVNSRVVSALDFGPMGTAMAQYDLAEAGGKTTVTWSLIADMSKPPVIGRWMGLMMDGWVGADYEKGLAKLKDLIEN